MQPIVVSPNLTNRLSAHRDCSRSVFFEDPLCWDDAMVLMYKISYLFMFILKTLYGINTGQSCS